MPSACFHESARLMTGCVCVEVRVRFELELELFHPSWMITPPRYQTPRHHTNSREKCAMLNELRSLTLTQVHYH
eukprot:scaffold12009_cov101-Isochrysis_galbana.AAC.5